MSEPHFSDPHASRDPESRETHLAEDGLVDATAAEGGRPWIRFARLAFAVVLMAVGVFLVVQSFDLGWESRGTSGPGFFPFWVGLLLTLTAAGWGVIEFRASVSSQVHQDLEDAGVIRMLKIVAAFMVLIFIFEPVGYNLSVLAFLLYMTFSMGTGKGRAWVNVVVSLAGSIGVYLIFELGLGVTLPDSIIPFLADLGL